ncbi:sensor histidine kinase [Rubrivirga marina]|uniref:Histidine kinase domain-containing protein n=1 Tax=Rubrivirga marina TaxID=1196024 RepID=A0A271J1K0_9BACT|nr:two-component regulator propeller domain-containing protein [Rubrivirga marina]PAP76914.1 hypothetical protein BSZ37_10965 [Rubrivirga marina]
MPILRRALLAACLAVALADAQPAFDTLTRVDGLPSDFVQAVYQDRFGFLWFGTDAGLARYDGRRVVPFTADDGLPDPFVYAIGEDGDGTLWVGTFRGLARREGGGFAEVETPFGDDPVLSVSQGPAGELLIRTGTHAALRRGGGWRVLPVGEGSGWAGAIPLPDGSIATSHRVGPTDDDAWELRAFPAGGGPPTPVASPEGVVGPRWLSEAGDGLTFCAGLEGVALGRIKLDRFVAEAVYPLTRARRVVLGSQGEVYAVGDNGGVWVADAPDTEPVLLSPLRGQDLIVDREGGVWVGTFGQGVLRLAGRHVERLTEDPTLRLTAADGVVWATGRDGLVRVDARTRVVQRNAFREGLREVAPARRGVIVTRGASAYALSDPMAPLGVLVAEDPGWISGIDARTDTLWVSGYGSGVVRQWSTTRDTIRADDGLGTDMVEGLVRTRRGVWALTRSNGAALLRGRRVTTVDRVAGLPSSAVYAVAEARDGTVWFGTDRGLGQWDGARARAVGEEALGRQRILAVFERPADRGAVYAIGDRGLYRAEAEHVRPLGAVLYGAASRASINDAAYSAASDRLFLATSAGLVSVDLARIPNATTPPQVALLSVRVDDAVRALGGAPLGGDRVSMPAGRHRVEVQFAALLYSGAAVVEYRVGRGPWERTGPEHRVVFSDLGAGDHVVEARAVGPDGARSAEVARLTLAVAPRWWERPPVVLGLVALALLAFGAAVRSLSQRRLRREVERLEVERRVQDERERISRDLHDHVGAQLSSLLAGVELAKLARRARGGGASADPLEAVESDARETIRQLRETIWALHDETLTAGAFCHRLDAYAKSRVKGRIGTVSVVCEGSAERELPPVLALSLYRVAQEAITNALKHSGAQTLTVRLRPEDASVVLVIEDDGTFVEPAGGDGLSGFGLGSMRTRAERLGGTFDLATEAGTRVRVRVPLDARPSPA